jgi:hypothetical protein
MLSYFQEFELLLEVTRPRARTRTQYKSLEVTKSLNLRLLIFEPNELLPGNNSVSGSNYPKEGQKASYFQTFTDYTRARRNSRLSSHLYGTLRNSAIRAEGRRLGTPTKEETMFQIQTSIVRKISNY